MPLVIHSSIEKLITKVSLNVITFPSKCQNCCLPIEHRYNSLYVVIEKIITRR